MKLLQTAVLSLIACTVYAQDTKIAITGSSTIKKDGKMVMTYRNGRANTQDTIWMKDGKFTFNRTIQQATRARLAWVEASANASNDKLDELSLYLSNEPMHIKMVDSLSTALVSGGELTTSFQKYTAHLKPNSDVANQLDNKWRKMNAEEQQKFGYERSELRRKLGRERKALMLSYAKENPDSYFSLLSLYELSAQDVDVPAVKPLYDQLNTSLKQSPLGKTLGDKIAIASRIEVGSMAPDFEQADLQDKMLKLSDFKGKYVLLDFWASWCGPCRAENPNLVRAYEAFKGRNFEILGVSLDYPGKKEHWVKAVEMDKLTWPQVSDLNGWNNKAAKLYAISAVPQSFLIDPTGKIIARNLSGEHLHEFLEKNLPK